MGTRDDRFWAEFFGVDPSAWRAPGLSVRAHAGLTGYRGLWCFRRAARTVVSAPAGWVAALASALDRADADLLFREHFVADLLGSDFDRLIGPTYQGCLDARAFRPAAAAPVRLVGPRDATAVAAFRTECGEDAWEESGLGEATRHGAAYFDGGRIAALAAYRPWNGWAGDPCVLTHPECRGRGRGTAVVSRVVAAVLAAGDLPLYQTLASNRGAVRIASRLGYEQYATHVAIRLNAESPSGRPAPRT